MKKLKNAELNRLSIEEFRKETKAPIAVVLDNIRSLSNVGSVFRTADAFRVKQVLLCGITACPPHRDIQKTALGATESVEWKYYQKTEEALAELRKSGYAIYAIEQTDGSIDLNEFEPSDGKALAVVFGHEVYGVQQNIIDLSDGCIEIPQFGTKHSMNVSVSAGIVLWDIYNKII